MKMIKENAIKGKNDFILENVVHPLRTPINRLMSSLSMIKHMELTDKQLEYIEEAELAGEELLLYVNALIEPTELKSNQGISQIVVFDIRSLAEECIDFCVKQAEEEGIELNLLVHSEVPEKYTGDSKKIKQVVMNLIMNILKLNKNG